MPLQSAEHEYLQADQYNADDFMGEQVQKLCNHWEHRFDTRTVPGETGQCV